MLEVAIEHRFEALDLEATSHLRRRVRHDPLHLGDIGRLRLTVRDLTQHIGALLASHLGHKLVSGGCVYRFQVCGPTTKPKNAPSVRFARR